MSDHSDFAYVTFIRTTPERLWDSLISAVSESWPELMASLKTLLETGAALPGTVKFPDGT